MSDWKSTALLIGAGTLAYLFVAKPAIEGFGTSISDTLEALDPVSAAQGFAGSIAYGTEQAVASSAYGATQAVRQLTQESPTRPEYQVTSVGKNLDLTKSMDVLYPNQIRSDVWVSALNKQSSAANGNTNQIKNTQKLTSKPTSFIAGTRIPLSGGNINLGGYQTKVKAPIVTKATKQSVTYGMIKAAGVKNASEYIKKFGGN